MPKALKVSDNDLCTDELKTYAENHMALGNLSDNFWDQ